MAAEPPLRLVPSLPGRGRSYVSTRGILPGEILLTDLPILLYPPALSSRHCACCFRTLLPQACCRCPSCSSPFCSPSCLSTPSHTPYLCRALTLLPPSPHPDLLFLLHAYSLASSSPSSFSALLSLHRSPSPPPSHLHHLHSLLPAPPPPVPFSPDLTAALLAVDRANAFGLMDAADVRAYGIYPNASFFNHDCLPNACRFDYVDRPVEAPRNTEIFVRALHEIPQGREICLSYFPVNWGFAERQRRLWEEYGFRCVCDRCEVEKNWKEEDAEGMEEDDGEDAVGDDDNDNDKDVDEEEGDADFPHAYFFVKFQCRREGCGGTLAPLPPSSEGLVSDQMECNACGCIMKDEEEDGGEEGEGSAMVDD